MKVTKKRTSKEPWLPKTPAEQFLFGTALVIGAAAALALIVVLVAAIFPPS